MAMKSIVIDRAANDALYVVDGVPWKDEPKTKVARAWLAKLGVQGRTLVVTAEPDVVGALCVRNLPDITHTFVGELSAYDLAAHRNIVLTKDALAKLEEKLA